MPLADHQDKCVLDYCVATVSCVTCRELFLSGKCSAEEWFARCGGPRAYAKIYRQGKEGWGWTDSTSAKAT